MMKTPLRRGRLTAVVAAISSLTIHAAAHAQDQPGPNDEAEVDEVVVQATRSGRRVQDEPIRVEVINREETEEKLLMRPGNIAVMLSETGGLRVQVTSPSLGASNVRVQGMRGRYTQLLTDGLPLYGGQTIGLLQIAPTDLGQVEVIKGAASALYGPSALGGVINLVSRRPSPAPTGEALLNLTSRNGRDLTGYASAPVSENCSYSVVSGLHRQSRHDLDGDGWADIPAYERWTLRPRLFWEGDGGATAFLTLGAMGEDRRGGTLPGRTAPDGTAFPQSQDSRRLDGGVVAAIPLADRGVIHLRASGVRQKHEHVFGEMVENDRHDTLFAEGSFSAKTVRTSWLAGLAVQQDVYWSGRYPAQNYKHVTPGAFVQVEHDARDDFTVAASARWDDHNDHGSRLSPRLSMLYRPGPWTFRASVGRGFYAPTPFVEEIDGAGLSRLEPLSGLRAETAETASLEAGYSSGPFEATVTLFASSIKNAVRLEDIPAAVGPYRVRLVNVEGATRTEGAELLLRYKQNGFTVTGSYVYVDATEPGASGVGRRDIPLTPRHTAGLVAMWEKHGKGRVGFEAYYTGRQDLEDDPYRSRSRPYVELGLLGEMTFGKVSVFLNLENLLNVRQTKYAPLVLPRRASDGGWTVDAWAPTDGFVANGGFRVRFGG